MSSCREFVALLGGAADWMAGVVRAQLSTGGNVTVKRLDQKLSAGYHARLNVRVLRRRDVGSGAER
jgi:hypothetical protein